MKSDELKKLQFTQLKMMDLIHNFCVENNIKYYIIGGTLLGAVRHKGFIPWDLDIDIAMLRDDYDKFMNLSDKLPSCLEYHCYKNYKNYSRPHCEVGLKNTMINAWMDKYNKKKVYNGIFVDIFPLDYVPNNENLQKKQYFKIKKIRRILGFKDGTLYGDKGKLYKIIKRTISFILKIVPYKLLGKLLEKQMTKYNDSDLNFVCSMASRYDYFKQKMALDVYGDPILLEFEGRQYYAPCKPDIYLSNLYGDYMKLPPIESRKGEMDYFDSIDYCYITKKYRNAYVCCNFEKIDDLNIHKFFELNKYCKHIIVEIKNKENINLNNKYKDNNLKNIKFISSDDNMIITDLITKYNLDAIFVNEELRWKAELFEIEEKLRCFGVDIVYIDNVDFIDVKFLERCD